MPIPGPNFAAFYPLSSALLVSGKKLQPVSTGQAVHALFDFDDLKLTLGTTRFNNLIAWLVTNKKTDYVCGHRTDSKGCEIHCISADDLEAFLKGGN